ncbi:MAG: DUF1963 domain-containing protein, partial [Deltaproteobacteria bacterium]|nr:DUF1963 domain-containing protein [Deltaproteobacteria bacterium]
MRIQELRARLQNAGLDPRYADVIESNAQRCVRFKLIPSDEREIAVGQTKFGGSPDLPPDIPWPEQRGRQLSFFIQLGLQDFNQYPICSVLPPKGRLYFFGETDLWSDGYDRSDQGNWR